ncbi:MAG: FliM/FliN family flagellar motor switch protein [Planctomycetaceae bacterium]|nr:FliM/FliN family flagellar motor switch protein [Planctomycetaceae bacterium]
MSLSPLERLNFSEPRQLSAAEVRHLQRWQTNTCERITEAWGGLLFAPVGLVAGVIEPAHYRGALKSLPDPGIGVVLEVGDELIPTLLAVPSRLALGLLNQMLGPAEGEWPRERSLSPLEETLFATLVHEVSESISDGWPGIERLRVQLLESCRPRRCRRLPAESELVRCRWEITSGCGAESVDWLLPRASLEQLLETEEFTPVAADHQTDLEAIVLSLPVELSAQLGQTRLTMAELADIAAGDVLLLDQSVDRPLPLSVDGSVHWKGSACRVGPRQALQITAIVDVNGRTRQ